MNSIIVDDDFLLRYDVCQSTVELIRDNNLLGLDVPTVLRALRDMGIAEPTVWWNDKKKTKLYFDDCGGTITMGAYQVFNPLTGQYTRYETEAEAKVALVDIANQVLAAHCPNVIQEISNENNDTTWVPTEIHKSLVISC